MIRTSRFIVQTSVVLAVLLLQAKTGFSQDRARCDSIYTLADALPAFGKEDGSDIFPYLYAEIIPNISRFYQADGQLPTHLFARLTISASGSVIDAKIERMNASEECKKAVEAQLLSMPAWTPACHDGREVCAYAFLPVRCIMWQN